MFIKSPNIGNVKQFQTSVYMLIYASMFGQCVCVPPAPSHLSDLLTHQREQPDVKQHLPSGGRNLEVDHQHHRKQEEEGEVRHNIPVKLNLRRAVQADQSGPDAQWLHAPQASGVTVDRKVQRQLDVFMFNHLFFSRHIGDIYSFAFPSVTCRWLWE